MKKIGFIIMGIALMLMGCESDPKTMVDPASIVRSEWTMESNTIFPSHDSIAFTFDKVDAELHFDTIRWSPAEFGYKAAVTYSIQMSIKNEGEEAVFSDFKTVATTIETFYALKIKDINTFILTAGGVKRRPTDIKVRISAAISNSYPTQNSEGFDFSAITYSTDPDLLHFVYVNEEETVEYIYAPQWDGLYKGYSYLPNTSEGVWLVEEINPDVKWGIVSSTETGNALSLVKESDGGQPIKPGAFSTDENREESFVETGYYSIEVDMRETTLDKTIKVWRFYSKFFICGQRNMNYIWWGNNMSGQDPDIIAWNVDPDKEPIVWGTGVPLNYYPEEGLWKSETVYVPRFQTAAGAPPQGENTSAFEFKFRANWRGTHNLDGSITGGTWQTAANLGGAQTDVVNEDGIQIGKVSGGSTNTDAGNGNIRFNGVPGYYQFIVDIGSYPTQYQIVPVSE